MCSLSLCAVDLEIPAPPPPPFDCLDGFDDMMPPLPPPVDYDSAVPANYLEKGRMRSNLLCHVWYIDYTKKHF